MKKIILSLLCILSMQVMAQTNMELAKQALDNDDYDAVIEYTTKHLSSNTKDVEAHLMRAIAFAQLEEYARAFEDANAAVKSWNKKSGIACADVYAVRAYLYEQVEEYDQAYADYNAAVKMDKKNPEAYENRAEFLYKKEKYAEALP